MKSIDWLEIAIKEIVDAPKNGQVPGQVSRSGKIHQRVVVVGHAQLGHAAQAQPPDSAVHYESQLELVIPQSAIDEIVNRVSALLSERLSGEIARRIAPEVAELVKRQLFAEPAPYRDPENLLDIE